MRLRLAALSVAALLLAGCSDADWSDAMNTVGLGDDAPVQTRTAPQVAQVRAAAAAPTPVQPATDPFCMSVAQQDAMGGSFDTATQQRVLQRSYAQCVAMFSAAR